MIVKSIAAMVIVAVGLTSAAWARPDEKPQLSDATLGAKPPEGATALLSKEKADAWVHRDGKAGRWTIEDGVMTVKPGSGDVQTKDKFDSFKLHVEFNVPHMPEARGQARGNSGVYMQGSYELQVLDSYGLKSQDNDCGGIYKQYAPSVNACKKPGEWQTYDVTFDSAIVKEGKTEKKARITVIHNGVKIIDDKEISPTPGGSGNKEGQPGPILLQDHGNLVQYRNIWIQGVK